MEPSLQNQKQRADAEEQQVQMPAAGAPATATRPVRHYRAYLFQVYMVMAIAGFAGLLILARTTPYFSLDLTIENAVQTFRWAPFDWLMQFLSYIGFAPLSFIWCAAVIVVVFLIGLRWEAVMTTVSVAGVMLLGLVIKDFVRRDRPTADLVRVLSPISEYSFPSGHVLFYVGFLGFLVFLIYTLAPHSWWRMPAVIVLGSMIALVGVSRIYLGQHWPSDVLGAYLLSSVWLALMIYVYRWGKPRFFVHQPAAPEHATAETKIQ